MDFIKYIIKNKRKFFGVPYSELLELVNEKELNLWILSCIKMHPRVKSFKTMSYLNKLKYYEKNKLPKKITSMHSYKWI